MKNLGPLPSLMPRALYILLFCSIGANINTVKEVNNFLKTLFGLFDPHQFRKSILEIPGTCGAPFEHSCTSSKVSYALGHLFNGLLDTLQASELIIGHISSISPQAVPVFRFLFRKQSLHKSFKSNHTMKVTAYQVHL